jgi:protocatechuate 3,4-dioxygenase beta subunit
MVLSRRTLLAIMIGLVAGRRLGAAAGQTGLEGFTLAGPPCTPDERATPAVPADASYRPGAPERSSLVERGVVGTPLTWSGTVTGLTCGRVKGALVEVWQADAHGVYGQSGFRLRGTQRTDADGAFRFETIVPGAAPGRAPHIGVHVVVAGKPDFWTELFFPNDPQNAKDARFNPRLVLTMGGTATHRTGMFDLVLTM